MKVRLIEDISEVRQGMTIICKRNQLNCDSIFIVECIDNGIYGLERLTDFTKVPNVMSKENMLIRIFRKEIFEVII